MKTQFDLGIGSLPLAACTILLAIGSSFPMNFATTHFSTTEPAMKYSIAIHGGAGRSPLEFNAAENGLRRASMEHALKIGVDILAGGGKSLDAVEAVVKFLENDPQFNAGVGAVFNASGSHELDASIMDGATLNCGAVAGVSHVKNPIELARLVMTDTRHVLLNGTGAEEFAKLKKVEWVEPNFFDTPAAKASWDLYRQTLQEANNKVGGIAPEKAFDPRWDVGTVGCVALDAEGNLAAATSTGGITYKQFGRVGDSPIVGAGTYADNRTCAVSGTGIGEQYIRYSVAYDVSAQLKYAHATLQAAVDDNLQNRLNANDGGLIAVDKDGNIAMGFNTGGMARAAADSDGRFEVLWD